MIQMLPLTGAKLRTRTLRVGAVSPLVADVVIFLFLPAKARCFLRLHPMFLGRNAPRPFRAGSVSIAYSLAARQLMITVVSQGHPSLVRGRTRQQTTRPPDTRPASPPRQPHPTKRQRPGTFRQIRVVADMPHPKNSSSATIQRAAHTRTDNKNRSSRRIVALRAINISPCQISAVPRSEKLKPPTVLANEESPSFSGVCPDSSFSAHAGIFFRTRQGFPKTAAAGDAILHLVFNVRNPTSQLMRAPPDESEADMHIPRMKAG